MIKRALLSVSDKTGIIEFAKALVDLGVELVSTGGTYRLLSEHGIPVRPVDAVTGFPEILDGRVKTLHPHIHGGILARRDREEHMQSLVTHGIRAIDLVVCNLYPFAATIAQPHVTLEEAIENIDIGGPSMVRAAAKNHAAVTVVTDPERYAEIIECLRQTGEVPLKLRQELALAAFRHTANYDAMIAAYLGQQYAPDEALPETITLTFERQQLLRYGENPHQVAAFYREPQTAGPSLARARQLQGKELSFCNLYDADAALSLVQEFSQPAAVAVKHTNPCGVACANDILTAYQRAHDADPVSIFGGIVALNRPVEADLAEKLTEIFLDIVIAPEFTPEAQSILSRKKNLRLLAVGPLGSGKSSGLDYKRIAGGLLVQTPDTLSPTEEPWRTVTDKAVTAEQMADLQFAWRVVKYVKSNAIVVAKGGVTLGIGMGQVNRIAAAKQALARAGQEAAGAVLASDGLFPFPDVVEAAAAAGIAAIVQPGGSIRDDESITAANRHNLAMVFTGHRHFR
ncbi:MAG: bifunctional phosphoribosylaminoimidazolecarboxamide formyltransferase/IMP cyclohydrolase, partial [Firmicutes bacterium]|nr:bifunctional phosphoribosylaminoimidazolecarboxamide formyltransferase/IMP cyclohydrolase [Bacillota bacterium]